MSGQHQWRAQNLTGSRETQVPVRTQVTATDSDEEQEQWMEKTAGVKGDSSVVGPLPVGSSSITGLIELGDSSVVGPLPVGSSSITGLIELGDSSLVGPLPVGSSSGITALIEFGKASLPGECTAMAAYVNIEAAWLASWCEWTDR
ncbi:uncharacterized protein LOC110975727 isoform X2 [Acanthaster planci]|uniref:Uncharacterized protein LOC110975727 isoform X2 n=1 Tax=Acanthaster planci TaxID=133434 RepID=A0A8B7XTG8_ACAPL|nr:uncharacterized protein LOC110975727 isoform X2 [Acanthaster planci]